MDTQVFDTLDPARRDLAYRRAAEKVREVKETIPSQLQPLLQEIESRKQLQTLKDSVPFVFNPLWQKARNKGAHGGRGSAKSQTFARMLLYKCKKQKGVRAVCVREVQKSLEQSVKRLLEDIIELYSLQGFRVLTTHIETPGDGIIIFNGMQNHTAESIKSLEGYDVAWVEEAQSLSERSLTLLRPTIRKEESELWFTWNPHLPSDPIDKLLRGETLPPDSIVVQANYHDNPFLPEVLRKELEWDQQRDVDKYNHIWLGQYERHSNARVFRNWRVEPFETPGPPNAPIPDFLFGGDWGFAVDPSVAVRGYIIDRTLYIDHEVYQVGCEIDNTPALFDGLVCGCKSEPEGPCKEPELHGFARNWTIVTDSARPETISYMQRHLYPLCEGAVKGAHSIEEGIQFLKNYDIVVHPRCTHTIDELTMYSFKKHPLTDEIIPVLEDKKNHVIDSLRYMVEPIRNPGDEALTW